MVTPRAGPGAIVLKMGAPSSSGDTFASGKASFVGSAELFDPKKGTFAARAT
jgi:hypothetical protein